MAKPMQNLDHHPNCSCCGKQPSFKELGRRPSGFGALKSALLPKKPTPHTTTKFLERAGTTIERQEILQHGIEAIRETSLQDTFEKLTSGDHSATNIAIEILEDVIDRNQLQAKESRLKRTSKDKESLLEECCALKIALADQLYHLQLHKVHHESVHLEQRRMEIAIEELEVGNGLEAPRTGGISRLKAKLLGLKCRQEEYSATLTTLRDDLETLKKDPRVSFTNEANVERDVFATETKRLQNMVQYLRTSYHKICAENNKFVRLRENIAKLKTKIQDIQTSIKDKKTLVEKMKKDINKAKVDAIEAQYNIRNTMKNAQELESHSTVLEDMLTYEKQEKNRIQTQTLSLSEQTRIVRQTNADEIMVAKMAQTSSNVVGAPTNTMTLVVATWKAGKGQKGKGGNNVKLKQSSFDRDVNSDASKSLSDFEDAYSDATKKSKGGINKDFLENKQRYFKEVGIATNQFVENAPRSKLGSSKAKVHTTLGSLDGDHLEYELVRDTFQKEENEAENRFLVETEKDELGSTPSRRNVIEEAKRLATKLEAMKKTSSTKAWLENWTIELDGKTLKPSEYTIDVQDLGTNVRITSQSKSPQALAKKKGEEDARKKKEAEDATKQGAQDEERRKKEGEEATIRANKEGEETGIRANKEGEEATIQAKREGEEATIQVKKEGEEATIRANKETKETTIRAKKEGEEATIRANKETKETTIRAKKEGEEAMIRGHKAAVDVAKSTIEIEGKKEKDVKEATKKSIEVEKAIATSAYKATVVVATTQKNEFFDDKMQGVIKKNIKEVLSHLETISESVQQKATSSSTAEDTVKDILDKIDKSK